jgi:hypothetical protein
MDRVYSNLRGNPAEPRGKIRFGHWRMSRSEKHGMVGGQREQTFDVAGRRPPAPLLHQVPDLLVIGCHRYECRPKTCPLRSGWKP